MNIVLYVNSFLPALGGKEIVVHYLADEYQKMGHDVRIVGPSGWIKQRRTTHAYSVHRWPTLRGLYPEKVGYAQLMLDTAIWGCDVIHAHTTYPNGYLAAILKQKRQMPLVITPHGHDIHVIPELGFGHRLDPVKRKKIEFSLNRAEIVTAISDSVVDSLLDAGCDEAKIRKIPNGIDVERFQGGRQMDVRKWLAFPDDARLILSVGNYHPRKGQDVIIEAMPKIISRIPNARLVIVGARQEPLAQKIHALTLDHAVRLTGAIPFPLATAHHTISSSDGSDDHLAALYCQSDVYVSSSVNKEAEGLSLAMLDAMAAKLPVVATQISGSSDIVVDGQTGVLVPPADHEALADAIAIVLEDRSRGVTMGERGEQIARDYRWTNIAKKYLDVYLEAMSALSMGIS